MSRPPAGTKLTCSFFRDSKGRLRCTVKELSLTKPVEAADQSKRYRWAKVFQLYDLFSEEDYWKLQLANAGDVIEVKVQ